MFIIREARPSLLVEENFAWIGFVLDQKEQKQVFSFVRGGASPTRFGVIRREASKRRSVGASDAARFVFSASLATPSR